MLLFKKLFYAIRNFIWPRPEPLTQRHPELVFAVEIVEDAALDELNERILYVETRGGKHRWAHLQCPCGCGDVISVNLMTSHYPHWRIAIQGENVTLSPSIDKTDGCKSHFFVRNSKIVWAGSTN